MGPGHIGIEGNERADLAAKQAASKPGSVLESLSLVFTRRAHTEASWEHKQSSLDRALAKNSNSGLLKYPLYSTALDAGVEAFGWALLRRCLIKFSVRMSL